MMDEKREEKAAQATGSFADMGLLNPLLQAVKQEGYEVPTPIQQMTIRHVLAGKDVLGCAQTGTGKTAAFTLPILQYLTKNAKMPKRGYPRVLILAPTRELAGQIEQSIRTYGRFLRVTSTVIYGGVSQSHQVKALSRGVDILVATPGRLLDLMGQRFIHLDEIEIFVLDEADRMLDMGFIHDIKKIITHLPHKRQSLFFSATLEPAVIALAKTLVHDPVHVSVEPEKPTVEKIKQSVYFVNKESKDALLKEMLKDPKISRVIIFTQMKHVANKVTDVLNHAGIRTAAIHGNKSQGARITALNSFKKGSIRVLVATDIAARGIDIDDISHVINYDLPTEPETYVHRIGRTARAGAEGDAISFCCAPDRDYLRAIERLIHKTIPVVEDHPYHSHLAMVATGSNARPPFKYGGGHGGWGNRGGGNRSGKRRFSNAPSRHGRSSGGFHRQGGQGSSQHHRR